MTETARRADGFRFLVLQSVGSTNTLLGALARHDAPGGTVVIAREQRAGRGRRGHEWVSPRGNLHMSVLLRPSVAAGRAGQIGFVAGLAIAEALADRVAGHAIWLKWPNDVLVDDRKIAGILSEATIDGERLAYVVLGIGVNLASAPGSGMRWPATALVDLGAEPCDPLVFAADLTRRLAHWMEIWQRDGFEPVRSAWLDRAWGLGRDFRTEDAVGAVSGRFDGIDADGALVLASPGGARRLVRAGEIHPREGS